MRAAVQTGSVFIRTALIAAALLTVAVVSVQSERTARADNTTASMAFRVFTDTSKSVESCDIGAFQRQCSIIGDDPFSVHIIADTPPQTGFHTYRASVAYDGAMTLHQQVDTSENVWPFCDQSLASEVKGVNTYRTDCSTGGTTNVLYSEVIVNLQFSCPASGGLRQLDLVAGTDIDASRYIRSGTPSTVFLKSVDKGGTEVTDAVVIECLQDSDDDGMPDVYEKANPCLDQAVADAGLDGDSDGLTNGFEFDLGTEPCVADTDGDGLDDGPEVNGATSAKPELGTFFTDPFDPDTDGDGCDDGAEVGTNQLLGGGRDPTNFWDFYDVWTPDGQNPGQFHRNGFIDADDIVAVASRFLTSGTATSVEAALTPPTSLTEYHASADRGPSVGPNVWNRGQADGVVTADDITVVAAQFFHGC